MATAVKAFTDFMVGPNYYGEQAGAFGGGGTGGRGESPRPLIAARARALRPLLPARPSPCPGLYPGKRAAGPGGAGTGQRGEAGAGAQAARL